MPKGSVAHTYCDFMEREGLSAAGLVGNRPNRAALAMTISSSGLAIVSATRMT